MSESPSFEQGPDCPKSSAADRVPNIDHPPAEPALFTPIPPRRRGIVTPVLLFLATTLMTLTVGMVYARNNPFATPPYPYEGIPFSFALMAILLSHEMGHYFMSRRHKVETTLPYFIPVPNLIGTLGAVIKVRSPVPDRRALLDIGAAGPIVGFIVSTLVLIIGFKLSEIRPSVETDVSGHVFPLLAGFIEKYFYSSAPDGYALYLHPVGTAGFLGLTLTMTNLLPIGSLDGGHIACAVFGEMRARAISRAFVVMSIAAGAIGILTGFYGLAFWGVWGILNLFIGLIHPPPVDSETPLDAGGKLIAIIAVLIFILTFYPMLSR